MPLHPPSGPVIDLIPHLQSQLKRLGLPSDDAALLEGVIVAQRERAKTMKEMAQNSRFFFTDNLEMDPKAVAKHLNAAAMPVLQKVQERLTALTEWSAATVHNALNDLATELQTGLGKVAQPPGSQPGNPV